MSHWTQASAADFAHNISMDFFAQLEKRIEQFGISRKELAGKMNVTPSAVSQILNSPPENPKGETLVHYARNLGLKVAVVAYDDNDPGNDRGPIYSGVFEESWKSLNRPRDLFDVQEACRHEPSISQVATYAWHRNAYGPACTTLGGIMLGGVMPGVISCNFMQSPYWRDIETVLHGGGSTSPLGDTKKSPVSQGGYSAYLKNQEMGKTA